MAPRTKVQQEEYNAKRRAESAAKKAPAASKGKPPAKNKTKTVVAAVDAKTVKADRAKARAASTKQARLDRAATEARVNAKLKAKAKIDIRPGEAEARARADAVALSLKAKAASDARDKPVTIAEGTPSTHTMARSYLRSGAPGLGKLRGKTYQATVSFTESQMPQLVEAAKFRGVSLAEMIRSAVVAHLNKGIK